MSLPFAFNCLAWSQVDNASPTQRKTFGLALSIILTLRLPQVLDKLDQILRYVFNLKHIPLNTSDILSVAWLLHLCCGIHFDSFSVCTSVILGGNDDLAEEESRLEFPSNLSILSILLFVSQCLTINLGLENKLVYSLIFLMNGSGDNMSSSRSQNEGPVPSKEFRRRQVRFLGCSQTAWY